MENKMRLFLVTLTLLSAKILSQETEKEEEDGKTCTEICLTERGNLILKEYLDNLPEGKEDELEKIKMEQYQGFHDITLFIKSAFTMKN